jgi:Rrf2 family protein
MKLNEGVEWGMHCVNILAGLPSGATLPTRALAEYHGISETYLSKQLQALANAGIVESVPGPRGGYRLMRLAEEITLLDVVEAIDGREPLFRCMEIRQRCPVECRAESYRTPCAIHVAMARADKAWRDALRSQTVADTLTQYRRDVNLESQQQASVWVAERTRHTMEKP